MIKICLSTHMALNHQVQPLPPAFLSLLVMSISRIFTNLWDKHSQWHIFSLILIQSLFVHSHAAHQNRETKREGREKFQLLPLCFLGCHSVNGCHLHSEESCLHHPPKRSWWTQQGRRWSAVQACGRSLGTAPSREGRRASTWLPPKRSPVRLPWGDLCARCVQDGLPHQSTSCWDDPEMSDLMEDAKVWVSGYLALLEFLGWVWVLLRISSNKDLGLIFF